MTISEYRLNTDFRAPKVNLKQGEMQSYRMYQKGSLVTGHINGTAGAPLIIADDSFAIIPSAVVKVKDIEIDGKPVIEKKEPTIEQKVRSQKVEIPAEYRAQMDKIKNTNIIGSIVNKSRNSVNGMLIGAGVGLLAAIIFKQHKFLSAIVGATAGGFIGYKVTSDAKKMPEVKTEIKPK